jgi:hypothetical protein
MSRRSTGQAVRRVVIIEPVDVPVATVRRYSEWFGLLAPKADKVKKRVSVRGAPATVPRPTTGR